MLLVCYCVISDYATYMIGCSYGIIWIERGYECGINRFNFSIFSPTHVHTLLIRLFNFEFEKRMEFRYMVSGVRNIIQNQLSNACYMAFTYASRGS